MNYKALFYFVLMASFSACTTETEPNVAPVEKVKSLQITKLRYGTVKVNWSRSPNDKGVDTLVVRSSRALQDSLIFIAAPDSQSTVSGLAPDRYYFHVRNAGGSTDTLNWRQFGPPTLVRATVTAGILSAEWKRDEDDDGVDTLHVLSPDEMVHLKEGATAPLTKAEISGVAPNLMHRVWISNEAGNSEMATARWTWTDPRPRFTSLAARSVRLSWDRPNGDTAMWVVRVYKPGSVVAHFEQSTILSSVIVPGSEFAENGRYEFTLAPAGEEESKRYSWAPAERSSVIRLYETADSRAGHWSGLILEPGNVRAVSVSAGAQDRQKADLVLATDLSVPITFISLISPSISSLSGIVAGNSTEVGDTTYVIMGGLDAQEMSSDLSNHFQNLFNAVDITGPLAEQAAPGNSAIIVLRTQAGHFARLELLRQGSGLFYGNDLDAGRDRFYIDVRASIQPTPSLPYAGRPHRVQNATKRAASVIKRIR